MFEQHNKTTHASSRVSRVDSVTNYQVIEHEGQKYTVINARELRAHALLVHRHDDGTLLYQRAIRQHKGSFRTKEQYFFSPQTSDLVARAQQAKEEEQATIDAIIKQ